MGRLSGPVEVAIAVNVVIIDLVNQVPATWVAAIAGIRRLAIALSDGLFVRPSLFRFSERSPRGKLDGPTHGALGDAERTLGLLDRRAHVVLVVVVDRSLAPRRRQRADAGLITVDRLGRRAQLGDRAAGALAARVTHTANADTPPLSSPSVQPASTARRGRAAELVAVRDDLHALEGYHSKQVDVDVRLNTNESPFPPPDGWFDAYTAELALVAWNRYPDRGATRLREAIAAWHEVPVERIFAANGSNEVLQTLLLAYAGPGRNVVTFEPTYQLHGHIARITGATVVEGPRNDDFTIDPGAAAALVAAAQPAVTFLCSPNNPTGLVESPAVLDAVLAAAPGLVVVDEAYAQFAALVGARSRRGRPRPAGCAHVLQDVEHGGGPSGLSRRSRPGSSHGSRPSCCPTTWMWPSRSPAGWRCGSSTRWNVVSPRSSRSASG